MSTTMLLAAVSVAAQQPAAKPVALCKADAGWSDPAKPQHVYGNTWYVGTCGITALLVTSDKGHVLIDGATREAAPQIEANIRALGFRIKDVRFILATHAHLDHAGGFARLQHDSGAVMVARGADADAIERGRGDRSDPQFTSIEGLPPVKNVRRIADGEPVTVGPTTIVAHATPRGARPGRGTRARPAAVAISPISTASRPFLTMCIVIPTRGSTQASSTHFAAASRPWPRCRARSCSRRIPA